MTQIATYSLARSAQEPRRQRNLCAAWLFHKGEFAGAEQPAFDDFAWEGIALPHCFNAEDTFTLDPGHYRGPAWYRKRFRLEGLDGGRAHLVFEGSFAATRVWLNGREIAASVDGYTGLAMDITEALLPGENVLAVRVDNTHNPDVLPGLDLPDYDLYGGLYREAFLIATGDVFVPRNGLRVRTPRVAADEATVEATVRVRSSQAREAHVQAVILDPNDTYVAHAKQPVALAAGENVVELAFPAIANPLLWSPDEPTLYRMVVTLTAGGESVDQTESRFGLRWFEFDRERGFFLNGEPLRLVGVNRHQDYVGLGSALPPRLQRADVEIMKEMGANFVRLSHYPQHPAFLDACDELGVCVYAEIASWQFIGGPKFFDRAEEMMRALIRRDANHPSVLLWGLLNEGRSKPLFERLNAAAHEEDPSRPTVYAENFPEEGTALGTVWIPDVLGLNYNLEILDELFARLPGRKFLCSEHTNAGTYDPGDPAGNAQQTDRIHAELEILEARPWMAGTALWCLHDYGTDYAVSRPIQRAGVLDEYRRPKESFHMLRARWRRDPVVHIEGHWNPTGEAGPRRVRVYTNCEQVALRLNGRDLGARSEGLIRTWEVPFEPGRLEAIGTRGGVQASHEVRTHGAPAQLRLEANAGALEGPGDGCWLTATLLDAEGAPVLSGQHGVEFTASGPARLRGLGGTPRARTIRGIARIAVTAEGEGEALIEAAAGRIRSGPLRIPCR